MLKGRKLFEMAMLSVAVVIAVVFSLSLAFAQQSGGKYVELKRENFQKLIDGKQVDLYTIKNKKGMVVKFTNLGAKVQQILVPDKNGALGDVAQGYETIDQVIGGQGSMGAFIGRYSNRIGGGKFTIEGKEYKLNVNDMGGRQNTLHGGKKGLRFNVLDAKQLSDSKVQMSYTFKDGEENFPGAVALTLIYSVTDKNEFVIEYKAKALDKATHVSFTGHTFYNLSGDLGKPILDHIVTVNSDFVLESDDSLAPTGVIRSVTGTPMDFRQPTAFGAHINDDYDLLKYGLGYDSCYVLNKKEVGELSLAASAYEPVSGRYMEIWSTEPGMQLYSGNFLEGKVPRDIGKGNTPYVFRSSFSFEPHHFPNSPNKPHFPSTALKAGETYSGKIIAKFFTK
jgi:aldose 1-epimerase